MDDRVHASVPAFWAATSGAPSLEPWATLRNGPGDSQQDRVVEIHRRPRGFVGESASLAFAINPPARPPSWGRARRGPTTRIRLQRHGVPDLHPDGLPAAEQRSILSPGTSRRRSTPGGIAMDRGQDDGCGAAAALAGVATASEGTEQRLWAVAGSHNSDDLRAVETGVLP